MIYYIIIPSSGVIDNSYVGALHGSAIKNHSDLGNKAPNIVNEMQCSIVVTDVAALKKLNIAKGDEVRLCLQEDKTSYGQRRNHFDVNGLKNTTDVYNYLKENEIKVSPTVVYV